MKNFYDFASRDNLQVQVGRVTNKMLSCELSQRDRAAGCVIVLAKVED